jgi:hypothetical protein
VGLETFVDSSVLLDLFTEDERWLSWSQELQGCRKLHIHAVSSEADAGTRTPDPLLTMEVLYQLSYVGAKPES